MIRYITNNDFLQLATLYAEYSTKLPVTLNPAAATFILTKDMVERQDFRAVGYFEKDILKGFVIGYAISKKEFYFSSIYVIIKNIELKNLIEFCFAEIKEAGYESWEADCTNKGITSILTKYGAKPIYTRYKKVL